MLHPIMTDDQENSKEETKNTKQVVERNAQI